MNIKILILLMFIVLNTSVIFAIDLTECEKLPIIKDNTAWGLGKERCYHDLATMNRNASICKLISPNLHRDSCYQRVAELTKNSELCNKIIDSTKKAQCYRLTPVALNIYWIQQRLLQIIPGGLLILYSILLFIYAKNNPKSKIAINKIPLFIFPLAFVLMLTLLITLINPGYRLKIISNSILLFGFILILYLFGSYLINTSKNIDLGINPIKKGGIYGAIIGLISALGLLNWQNFCYENWCDNLQIINFFGVLTSPFTGFFFLINNFIDLPRSLLRMFLYSYEIDKFGLTSSFYSLIIFLIFGLSLGYIYKKNTKGFFWFVFIISILLYLILGLYGFVIVMSSFG